MERASAPAKCRAAYVPGQLREAVARRSMLWAWIGGSHLVRERGSQEAQQPMIGPPKEIPLLLGEVKFLEYFLRGFEQPPPHVRLERRCYEQSRDASFRSIGCGLRHPAPPSRLGPRKDSQ